MIEKNAHTNSKRETILSHGKALELFQHAVEDALDESRKMGVPIPVDVDGQSKYELPDGSIVDADPWFGSNTAPPGWYERWGIDPPR